MKPMVLHPYCESSRPINKPDETRYLLQGRSTFGKDDPGLTEALGNQEPTLEDQDARMDESDDGRRDDFHMSTAHAVHDETWLPFMRHIKDREGWYEYARFKFTKPPLILIFFKT